jgi:hypothetical protein
MSYFPTVDELAARLHREGWSAGDMAVKYQRGWVWVVSGQQARRWIVAEAVTQHKAWRRFASAASAAMPIGNRARKRT